MSTAAKSEWLYVDAKKFAGCSRCGAAKGSHCTRPSGAKAWPPHDERIAEYTANQPAFVVPAAKKG